MPPAPSGYTAASQIPSSFKFAESIGSNAPLPRSDYYRAQHMLNQLWGQVGPAYFPDRPQPTFDPQIRPGVKDPQGFQTISGWSGIAYPRSTALTPMTWPARDVPDLRGMTVWRPPTPEGQLPQPGVYGLAPWVVQNLAHPSQYPADLPSELSSYNQLSGQLRLPITRSLHDALAANRGVVPVGRGDVLPESPQVIGSAASVPIHEWAHNFQSAGTLANQRRTEGGAEAFSRLATNSALRGLGMSPVYRPWGYPQWTASIQHDWSPLQILRNQFRYND